MRALAFPILLTTLVSSGGLAFASDDRVENLPERYRTWLEEEVTYIISEIERDVFLELESNRERDSFIEAFWRRRDENPSTPVNEYKEEHYRRLEYVNKFLGRDTFREGWETDMGRFYILLGEPRTRLNLEAKDDIYPAELWFYNNPELKTYGLPPFFYLLFFRRHGAGEMELYDPISDGPRALLTGVDPPPRDFATDTERAYNELLAIDPELAKASLSFRTDEGDLAQFQSTPFGTIELLDQIRRAPFYGLDTSYAERLDFERGAVESDYLFTYVPSSGMINVLPGPEEAAFLHWVIEMEPQHVTFVQDRDSGRYATQFITSVEIVPRDNPDLLVVQSRKESYVGLGPSEEASLHLPFAYSGMTPLVPGDFDVRIILRNRACPSREEEDCIKSYTLLDGEVTVPDWPDEPPILSDVVLGYDRGLRGGEPVYRAYRFGNLEVLPNPGGVYTIGDTVVAAVTPVNAPESAQLRFRIANAEIEGDVRVDETKPIVGRGTVVHEMVLDGFDGGRYRLEAMLMDPSGRELDRRSVNVVVSPRTSIPRPAVRGAAPQIRAELPGLVSMTLGEQYLALENKELARELFETALAENGKLGPARERLAAMALEAGNTARVIELLEPVYARVQDRFEVLALLGQAYFREERYPECVELLEKAIVMRRPEPSVLNALAGAHYHVGELDRARELFERSLSIDPEQEAVEKLLEQLRAQLATKSP